MDHFIIINLDHTINEYITYNTAQGAVATIIVPGDEFFSPGWYYLTNEEMKHYEEFFSNST